MNPRMKVYDSYFSFGFESGGKYSVFIKNCTFDELIFILAKQKEMNKCKNSLETDKYCYSHINYSQSIKIINGSAEFSGIINKKGIYMTKIIYTQENKHDYYLELKYKNPNSYLSYNYVQYIPFSQVMAIVSCFLFILWIINWLKHFSILNVVHLFLTLAFLFYVIEEIVFAFELKKCNISDYTYLPNRISIIFRILKLAFFIQAIMMLLNDIDKAFSFLYVSIFIIILFITFLFINISGIVKKIAYSFLLIFFVISLVYIHKNYIHSSRNEEHNYTRKPKLFLWFSLFYLNIIYFIQYSSIFEVYFPCIMYSLMESSALFLTFLIGFFYRLKKNTMKNYKTIDDEQSQLSEF